MRTLQKNCDESFEEDKESMIRKEQNLLSLAQSYYQESAPSVYYDIKERLTNATKEMIKDEKENRLRLVWMAFFTGIE